MEAIYIIAAIFIFGGGVITGIYMHAQIEKEKTNKKIKK